jgi:hypothetical protein
MSIPYSFFHPLRVRRPAPVPEKLRHTVELYEAAHAKATV